MSQLDLCIGFSRRELKRGVRAVMPVLEGGIWLWRWATVRSASVGMRDRWGRWAYVVELGDEVVPADFKGFVLLAPESSE